MERNSTKLTCAPRGIILDETGRVAGLWVRGKKRRFQTHLFEVPIEKAPEPEERIEDIVIDGQVVPGVRIQRLPPVRSFLHWGK